MGSYSVWFIPALSTKFMNGFFLGIDFCIVYDTLKRPYSNCTLNFAKSISQLETSFVSCEEIAQRW